MQPLRLLRNFVVLILVWYTACCGLAFGLLSFTYHRFRCLLDRRKPVSSSSSSSPSPSSTSNSCTSPSPLSKSSKAASSSASSDSTATSSSLSPSKSSEAATASSRVVISIVIPAKNEQASIARTIAALVANAEVAARLEVIVALAECTDNTEAEVLKCVGVYPISLRTVKSTSGRSAPLNAGAKAATGHIVMFLHADIILPLRFDSMVEASMSNSKTILGAFRFAWNYGDVSRQYPASGVAGVPTRVLQWFMPHLPNNALSLPLPAGFYVSEYLFDLRGRLFRRPEGDQVIFLRRDEFAVLGGFLPDHCCMEDYEFVGRVRSVGFRTGRAIDILPAYVGASPRREIAMGALFTSSVNLIMYTLYDVFWCHPDTLFRLYYHPWTCQLRSKIA